MKVSIIGGGISGLFCAYYLLKDGHDVTVIDNALNRPRTSSFNAGLITPSIGLAPAIGLGTIVSPYFGRSGPVYISLLEVIRNIRWFRIGLKKGLSGYEDALTKLGSKSLQLYKRLFEEERIQVDSIAGILGLYKDKEHAKEIAFRTGARFADREETMRMGFKNFDGGIVMDEEISINPIKLLDELKKMVRTMGASLLESQKAELNTNGKEIKGINVEGRILCSDAYVVSGGSWCPEILERVGYRPLILAARGLALLFDTSGEEIVSSPALFEDDGIGVSQHNSDTLRITSFFEMVGFKEEFSDKRRKWILDRARNHLVKFDRLKLKEEGVGFRPCTPDQLPVIGRIPGYENLYIASGHCRLGVTLAPATGRIIAGMISKNDETSKNGERLDREAVKDQEFVEQFSPRRFQK